MSHLNCVGFSSKLNYLLIPDRFHTSCIHLSLLFLSLLVLIIWQLWIFSKSIWLSVGYILWLDLLTGEMLGLQFQSYGKYLQWKINMQTCSGFQVSLQAVAQPTGPDQLHIPRPGKATAGRCSQTLSPPSQFQLSSPAPHTPRMSQQHQQSQMPLSYAHSISLSFHHRQGMLYLTPCPNSAFPPAPCSFSPPISQTIIPPMSQHQKPG